MTADLVVVALVLWLAALTGLVEVPIPALSRVRTVNWRDPIYLLLALLALCSLLGIGALYAEYGWNGLTQEDPTGSPTTEVTRP